MMSAVDLVQCFHLQTPWHHDTMTSEEEVAMKGKFSSHGPVLQKISCELAFVGPPTLTECDELRTNVARPDTLGGSQNLHKRLCLHIFLGMGDIWGGNRGMGKCISCVQVLTGGMTDGVVRLHEVDPEAKDT